MHFDRFSHHVSLRPFCHACQTTINPSETVRALISNEDSTALEGWIGPFLFPPPGMQPPQEYLYCRYPGCKGCARSPEVFTAHTDCLKLFYMNCKALSRLWIKAAWNSPWPRAEIWQGTDIWLTNSPLCHKTASEAAARLGMSQMLRLPLEVIEIIRGFSTASVLWRYLIVQGTADYIRLQTPAPEETKIPLIEILEWTRNSPIQYISDEFDPFRFCMMRIGLDSAGIRKIERLTYPPYDGYSSTKAEGCHSFILEECHKLSSVLAVMTDGYLRLILPKGHLGLQMWDTPCPPKLLSCTSRIPLCLSGLLRTIKLADISGLTFFCKYDDVYGIHGHTSAIPSAQQEYENIPERIRKDMTWVYVPMKDFLGIGLLGRSLLAIVLNDTILQIGQSNRFLKPEPYYYKLPSTLLYNDRRPAHPGQPITTLGVELNREYRTPFRNNLLVQPIIFPGNQGTVYHSKASLNAVRSARVFYDQDTSYCEGILLTYNHGGQQALGQCAIGVSRGETVTDPAFLYHRTIFSGNDRRVEIAMVSKDADVSKWVGWTCVEMRGMITFWYNAKAAVLLETSLG